MNLRSVIDQLKAPFPEDEVKFKPQAYHRDSSRALALPHIDARAVADRLDAVAGPENWSDSYHYIPGSQVAVVCRLTVFGVTKEGIGEAQMTSGNPEQELYKAAESDAFKRAAVKFGIGRYLYHLPKQWLPFDGKKFTADYNFPANARPGVAPRRSEPDDGPRRSSETRPLRAERAEAAVEPRPFEPREVQAAPTAADEAVYANGKTEVTTEQLRKIAELSEKLVAMGKTPKELDAELQELFSVSRREALTKAQASRLIDDYRTTLNGLYLAKRREIAEVPAAPAVATKAQGGRSAGARRGASLPKAAAL